MSKFEKICMSCGACCAYFRILLSPADLCFFNNQVPPQLYEKIEQISDYLYIMKGTNTVNPRCIALKGEIGKEVKCTIYELRPQICREFNPLNEDKTINIYCNRAREKHNLIPLTSEYLITL